MFEDKKELLKTEKTANNKTAQPHPQRINSFHDVRIQSSNHKTFRKSNHTAAVIQREEWRTSSLQKESHDASVSVGIGKKIHHTLPQKKIRKFFEMIDFKDKIRILQILGREADGIKFQDDTIELSSRTGPKTLATQSEPSDSDEEKVLNQKVLATLLSLRSNLTLGPERRLDDPKDTLDPNMDAEGNLDNISQIYQTIYSKIDECAATIQERENATAEMDKQKNPYAERKEDAVFYHNRAAMLRDYHERVRALIDSIIDHLILAEKTLADLQEHDIKETRLRPYDSENWLLDPRSKPASYHKRGYDPRKSTRIKPPKSKQSD